MSIKDFIDLQQVCFGTRNFSITPRFLSVASNDTIQVNYTSKRTNNSFVFTGHRSLLWYHDVINPTNKKLFPFEDYLCLSDVFKNTGLTTSIVLLGVVPQLDLFSDIDISNGLIGVNVANTSVLSVCERFYLIEYSNEVLMQLK